MNSKDAPPPVEMWEMFLSNPALYTAADDSPPPIIERALEFAIALAILLVPFENLSISNTPKGPFQKNGFCLRDYF